MILVKMRRLYLRLSYLTVSFPRGRADEVRLVVGMIELTRQYG